MLGVNFESSTYAHVFALGIVIMLKKAPWVASTEESG